MTSGSRIAPAVIISVVLHVSIAALLWPAMTNGPRANSLPTHQSIAVEFIISKVITAEQQPERPRPLSPRPAVAAPIPVPILESVPASTAPASATVDAAVTTPPTNVLPLIEPKFDAAYLHNPKPVYPLMAKRLGEQGKVVLRVSVSREGSVNKLAIITSSGSSRLDNAACQAVAKWQFIPATQGNEKVAAEILVPINFQLES